MLTSNKEQFIQLVKTANTFLLCMVIALSISNVALVFLSIHAFSNQVTTLLPPKVSSKITVSNSSVNDAYLQQMAEYFLLLKLNVSPASIVHNHDQLLNYVDSSSYHEVQSALRHEAKYIHKDDISSSFAITDVAISNPTLQVKISGQLKKWVGARQLETQRATYLVSMKYDNTIALISIEKIKDAL